MVAWAFSFAAATFFPVVLLGIFWRRANANGAIAGMIGGLTTTILYMGTNYVNPNFTLFGLSHLSAGLFGMIVNFGLQIVVSLATPPPPKYIQDMVDQLRIPVGEMVIPGTTHPSPSPPRRPRPRWGVADRARQGREAPRGLPPAIPSMNAVVLALNMLFAALLWSLIARLLFTNWSRGGAVVTLVAVFLILLVAFDILIAAVGTVLLLLLVPTWPADNSAPR